MDISKSIDDKKDESDSGYSDDFWTKSFKKWSIKIEYYIFKNNYIIKTYVIGDEIIIIS